MVSYVNRSGNNFNPNTASIDIQRISNANYESSDQMQYPLPMQSDNIIETTSININQ